jgi:acyl-CoA synthetase (NDP forming)
MRTTPSVVAASGYPLYVTDTNHSNALTHAIISGLRIRQGMKIIGPNTFGVVNLHLPLNASFTPEFSGVKKGGISLVSQSGGMSHLMGFLSIQNKVGLSKIIGLGIAVMSILQKWWNI